MLGLFNLALTLVVGAIVAGAIVAVVGTAGLMQFLATDMLDIASIDLTTIALVVLALSPVLLIGIRADRHGVLVRAGARRRSMASRRARRCGCRFAPT